MSKQNLKDMLLTIKQDYASLNSDITPRFLFSNKDWASSEVLDAKKMLLSNRTVVRKLHCVYGTSEEYDAWERCYYNNEHIAKENLPIDLGYITLTFSLVPCTENPESPRLQVTIEYFNKCVFTRSAPAGYTIETGLRTLTGLATTAITRAYNSHILEMMWGNS